MGPRVYLCVNYCSDVERREDQRSQQRSLQERVRQLEEANRQHGEEKATTVDRLSRERGGLRHLHVVIEHSFDVYACTCALVYLFKCTCTCTLLNVRCTCTFLHTHAHVQEKFYFFMNNLLVL